MMAKTILLAEDGRETQAVVRQILEGEGFMVQAVANGKDAVDALTDGTFHAAILDLGLPEVSGLEVLRHLRAEAIKLPVIVMSGRHDQALKAVSEGAQGYLVKPFTFEALREQIGRWVLCDIP
ncbi:MAG: response regulator [Nitrospirales bacterium]